MDTKELIPRLIEEFHYPPQGAKLVAEKLVACRPEIRSAFQAYWEDGDVPMLFIEGYSIQSLMKEHGMNIIAAILTLDWLARDPERALQSLKKGHDKLTIP